MLAIPALKDTMSLTISTADGAIPPVLFTRDRLLRLADVMEIVALGRTQIYEMIKRGAFPAPYKPTETASRWSENEVQAWVANCAARRLN